jgi:hypothetical protein
MKSNIFTPVLLVIVMALSFSWRANAGAAEDAQAAFSRFFPAFVARNQAEVAAMFAPDAQFYGTQLLNSLPSLRAFFNTLRLRWTVQTSWRRNRCN